MRMIFICCMCTVDMPDIAEKQKKNAASSLLTIFREDECWKKDLTERQSACLY